MSKIKIDLDEIISVSSRLQRELDDFLLTMGEFYKLSGVLERCWDKDKHGSFLEAMNDVKYGTFDIESACRKAEEGFNKIIIIAREYESKKFK